MNNPFHDISDPEQLRALVQDGVECERCKGSGGTWDCPCPDCDCGHTPLPNADLDALAACWCEGIFVRNWIWEEPKNYTHYVLNPPQYAVRGNWVAPPAYTTDPAAAMRLQVQYKIGTMFLEEYEGLKDIWIADHEDVPLPLMHKSLCHAITTAALVAALTEAIEGASDAGD